MQEEICAKKFVEQKFDFCIDAGGDGRLYLGQKSLSWLREGEGGAPLDRFAEKEKTCCFTGHRPSRLPWGSDETAPDCLVLKERMEQELEKLYGRGYRHFISGMARGTDLYFAEAVLAMRQRYSDVTLEAAVPCRTQADGWNWKERARYRSILEQCNVETMVQQQYTRDCMLRRNRYMVERSGLVLAAYDGMGRGGTMYTLNYAMDQGLETVIIPVPAR